MNNSILNIAFIGNYLPRQCGIATFTTSLCESVAAAHPGLSCFAVPITDIPEGYVYPDRVRFEIEEKNLESYRRAADFLNSNNPDIVCLQHEYGIFGGDDGIFILSLIRKLRMPIVTTLHTILQRPSARQRRILTEIAERSSFVVVMTEKAVDLISTVYNVPLSRIRLIPHGIPEMPFIDPSFYKGQYELTEKTVLLTFGLLSPNKGIEQVIRALPEIIKVKPETVYIVLGATHPGLIRHEGEAYRLSLQQLAAELHVEKHVLFRNRFVSPEELKEFLVMADIYITPYLYEEQITSGTLAYSFGIGNAIISTPYWHAAELLADGRGILVPFRSPEAIAEAVIRLASNDAERNTMRKNAFLAGREMTWPVTARKYVELFQEARMTRHSVTGQNQAALPLGGLFSEEEQNELPKLKLDHIKRLTDDTGMIQHAVYTVPNHNEGYCSDDNARALILMVLLSSQAEKVDPEIDRLAGIYLGLLQYAWEEASGRFRNFLNFDRSWRAEIASEDSHGRVVWALGTCLGKYANPGFQGAAAQLFEKALPVVSQFSSPRAWAFTIIAIHEYLQRFSGDRLVDGIREELSSRLFALYKRNADPQWPWFESYLTYDNAKLSHALILSGHDTENREMLDAGLGSLKWLMETQTSPRGHFRPVGSDRVYKKGEEMPLFDQQPLEANSAVSACLEAYRITGDFYWHKEAQRAFRWYLGGNDLSLFVFDALSGGCHDGLHVDRLNQNEGAESTLAFHIALSEMKEADKSILLEDPAPSQINKLSTRIGGEV
ncbi:glycosyltransferase family 4 protein [Leadbettera azotonutricia]|uniref:Mannosyltransferase n=1 Tax=Leadbettera azotonutricia (strain ATCC BAA-888 / DSM 13862 / ZAS-9) TaxID=545695 RepID=F5Y7G1_LEAAZ|nr:glycosyltransferase family 4 protein [Leadbettera azotonutricia]AEF82470.1 mannosyltransferase [Leadbettera azotonutricia ZAS-9]